MTAGGRESPAAHMVRTQLVARGIRDAAVLAAMRAVPRERFVPPHLAGHAYDDGPLPIGHGQTISQPLIVALMAEALALGPDDRVLEVGTGSGYAAAVLARCCREVWTLERIPALATAARARLEELGVTNVHVVHADGTLGWPDAAPFDGIQVTAGGPAVPEALVDQLAPGGRLVIPIGARRDAQRLVRVTRGGDDGLRTEDLGAVAFVPLVGVQGWTDDGPA